MKDERGRGFVAPNAALMIALATTAVLLIPFVAMQVTDGVAWSVFDFLVAGVLLFGAGVARKMAMRRFTGRRLAVSAVIGIALMYVWAELAVGILTDWGS